MKKPTLFTITMFALLAIVCGLVYLQGVADLTGSPDSATSSTMYVLKRRILHFAKENNKLPQSIDDVPFLEGFGSNSNTDYWGNKIELHIKDNTVTMVSYGKDKKPRGVGDNLDITAIFAAKTTSGNWADENDEGYPAWIKAPLK